MGAPTNISCRDVKLIPKLSSKTPTVATIWQYKNILISGTDKYEHAQYLLASPAEPLVIVQYDNGMVESWFHWLCQ